MGRSRRGLHGLGHPTAGLLQEARAGGLAGELAPLFPCFAEKYTEAEQTTDLPEAHACKGRGRTHVPVPVTPSLRL